MRLLPVQWGWYVIGNPLCRFFLRPTVRVAEDIVITPDRPLIIAVNHISRFDPFALCVLPRRLLVQIMPVTFLTAQKYYDIWWLKPFLWAFGSVPIKQFGWSLDDYLSSAVKSLESGKTLLLFPEGKVNPEHSKAKPGIGYLQSETQAQVLPIKIDGISQINFRDFFLRRCKMQILVEKPFLPKTSSNSVQDYQDTADLIMNKILSMSF